jgi:hypothetical protein
MECLDNATLKINGGNNQVGCLDEENGVLTRDAVMRILSLVSDKQMESHERRQQLTVKLLVTIVVVPLGAQPCNSSAIAVGPYTVIYVKYGTLIRLTRVQQPQHTNNTLPIVTP